jgi:hypothetical protein
MNATLVDFYINVVAIAVSVHFLFFFYKNFSSSKWYNIYKFISLTWGGLIFKKSLKIDFVCPKIDVKTLF